MVNLKGWIRARAELTPADTGHSNARCNASAVAPQDEISSFWGYWVFVFCFALELSSAF
jgi:hypothetical protein